MPQVAASSPFSFVVTKGCRALGVNKGARNTAIIKKSVVGQDTYLHFDTSSHVCNRMLWLSGNRKNIPAIEKGAIIRLHDGDPTHGVTVEVR